jgi:tetratricopeptide (TPR) repeat protein
MKKAGRGDDESRVLIELGRALPLGSDGARDALCDGLEERGLRSEAAAEGVVQTRLQGLWSLPAADAARRSAAASAERRDFAAAADLLERSLLGVVRQESGFSRQEGYLTVPRAVATYRALAKLGELNPRPAGAAAPAAPAPTDAERAEAAAQDLRRLAAVLPADTDWAIRCVAELDRIGRRDLGDGLYRENARLLEAVCDRYPAAALYHNSLAWLAARCGRDPDAALSHAKRAVELQPSNPAYLDTLAETYFCRGDKDSAVACMKKCLEQQPASPYFREQLKRFEAPAPQK